MNEEMKIAISRMNEIDTIEVLNFLIEHIEKNQWEHILRQTDYVDDLLNEIEELKGIKAAIQSKVEKAIADIDNVSKHLAKV